MNGNGHGGTYYGQLESCSVRIVKTFPVFRRETSGNGSGVVDSAPAPACLASAELIPSASVEETAERVNMNSRAAFLAFVQSIENAGNAPFPHYRSCKRFQRTIANGEAILKEVPGMIRTVENFLAKKECKFFRLNLAALKFYVDKKDWVGVDYVFNQLLAGAYVLNQKISTIDELDSDALEQSRESLRQYWLYLRTCLFEPNRTNKQRAFLALERLVKQLDQAAFRAFLLRRVRPVRTPSRVPRPVHTYPIPPSAPLAPPV